MKHSLEKDLKGGSGRTMLQVESLHGVSALLDTVGEVRQARRCVLDGNSMKTWPELIEVMSGALSFQQTFNKGYGFKLAAFIDCMRDVIDEADEGLILTFANANRILNRDRKYT
ncbi:MAG: barstar family protein, partial [Desulfobacterales bacterium]|nr:barstar family protein [Desulfobacterales bacterium]